MLDLPFYVIALYIRLSIEDSKVESLSIENQKSVLHRFADLMEGVGNAEVLEFIDNGYSGTNFERPAVQALLESVREGKINCIIVKDFTRFGRNSIEVGYFMEMVFPLYGVRFISINDDFDSANYHGDTGGLNVAFKYLIAEFYSRDLSVKSTTAKLVKMKRGEYQSKICLYGYQKGASGRMEPDPETAPNVQLMFQLALEGKSSRQIAEVLFARGICTPGEYKASKGQLYHDVSRCCGLWQSSSICRIISDERYTGTYIIGKRRVLEVGGSRTRLRDESEWIKIPNHHPAIVSKEVFDQVQQSFRSFRCPKLKAADYILRSKVYCGCCRHSMTRNPKKELFYCRYTRANAYAPCNSLSILEKDLENALYQIIAQQARIILNIDNLSSAGLLEIRSAEQTDCAKQIERLKDHKRVLYERLLLQEISLDEYKKLKEEVNVNLSRLERSYALLKTQITQMQMDEKVKKVRTKLAQKISGVDVLTAELADALIERVYVYPGNRLDIEWKIKDFCVEAEYENS